MYQPLIPDVAMPSTKFLWKNRKKITTGITNMVAAAIRCVQSTEYWFKKPCRPKDSVSFSVLLI